MRTTGKSGFKMKSGNKPSIAKMSGAPLKVNNFGVGKNRSPIKEGSYEDAKKKDPNLDKNIIARDKHKKGSAEYEKYQSLINKSYGKVRDKTALARDKKNLESQTNVEKKQKELDPADLAGGQEEQQGMSKLGALGQIAAQSLTGGLDAVYGTGKVGFGGGTRFSDKTKASDENKKNEKKFGETALDK